MTGPEVALVHGFGTSFEATWVGNGWAALLADAGRTVIGVDLLGHGTAEKPTDPDDYRNLEQWVLDVLPPEPVDGIGFSMGAQVLLWLAAHHSDRFGRLVVSGIGRNLFESDVGWRPKMVEAVRTGVAVTPELRYFAQLPESPGADRTALVAFLERPDRREFTSELLAAVTLPVLVVIGGADLAGPADPLVDALPDATLVVLPGVDHFATPKNFGFIEAALDFIDAQPL
jgi:pimeloyl-ACP methyl ester carboxylesterase|tara:strand:+ start:254 stop:940 length:687 start_codon:yes stop_codon:yes gene_type:complete